MSQILIVEDSNVFGPLLVRELKKSANLTSSLVKSFAECQELLDKSQPGDFVAAVLDLNLPDAPDGEVVSLVTGKGIPSVVFTSEVSAELRKRIWASNIVDYLHKDRRHSVTHLVQSIRRLIRNVGLKVMVVDDSTTFRNFVAKLLQAHGYQVIKAEDGQKALELYRNDPEIRLVVMDYSMPGMSGAEVAIAMRSVEGRRRRDDLAIIGMSAQSDPGTSIDFLKSGANDFILKPFQIEEFYCRVSQNVDMLNLFYDIRDMSNRDFLTGLYNRKKLFGSAQMFFKNNQVERPRLIAAIMDIDFFKKVNDTYGHDGGDAVLKHFSKHLKDSFGDDCVVARFGGEEFCVLLHNCPLEVARAKFEDFRKLIENSPVQHMDKTIRITVSTGVSTKQCETFEELLKAADELLYKAKETGRNQVCMD